MNSVVLAAATEKPVLAARKEISQFPFYKFEVGWVAIATPIPTVDGCGDRSGSGRRNASERCHRDDTFQSRHCVCRASAGRAVFAAAWVQGGYRFSDAKSSTAAILEVLDLIVYSGAGGQD
jgi:hypothetical protein